ncbi:hypothetical protein [Trichothermofontia sp.]
MGASLPLALWGLQRFQIRPTETAIEATLLPTPQRPEPASQPTLLPPLPAALPAPSVAAKTNPPVAGFSPPVLDTVAPAPNWGRLRVSNRTDYPVRVALLSQHPHAEAGDAETVPTYDEPVHWDFAPQEGSTNGLILSLPEQALRLQPGDVLVAFAQDGSRRYWGPYVVGKTTAPMWQQPEGEWQLILLP